MGVKINISKETLFQLYVVKNLNIIEIGKEIGCSFNVVYKRLNVAGGEYSNMIIDLDTNSYVNIEQ